MKMTKQFDELNDEFNVSADVVQPEVVKDKIEKVRESVDDVKKDYEYTRGNLYSIIEKGQEALNGILELAQESEIFEFAIDNKSKDLEVSEDSYLVYCDQNDLHALNEKIIEKFGETKSSQLMWKSENNIEVQKDTAEKLFKQEDIWPDLAVADLSFISLRLVLPAIKSLLKKNDSELLLLVKPQFEVGRERVGKGGIVRDFDSHVYALKSVIDSAISQGWSPKGLIPSPITGSAGNHEYLLWLGLEAKDSFPAIESLVRNTLSL